MKLFLTRRLASIYFQQPSRCESTASGGASFDILLVNVFVVQLNEDEIVFILESTLLGLRYLHFMRKIHREMKAGNVLCDDEGHAKLADSGLAGHLTVSSSSAGSSTL